MARFVVVLPLLPLAAGDEFTVAEWPLHVTLVERVGVGGAAVLGLAGSYQYLRPSLPDVSAIKDIRLQVPLRVFSRDGRLIAQFGEQRRIPLSFEAIPGQMINAVLAAEDDRFFQHGGVDYPGLARAVQLGFGRDSAEQQREQC